MSSLQQADVAFLARLVILQVCFNSFALILSTLTGILRTISHPSRASVTSSDASSVAPSVTFSRTSVALLSYLCLSHPLAPLGSVEPSRTSVALWPTSMTGTDVTERSVIGLQEITKGGSRLTMDGSHWYCKRDQI
ncbi:uncharacterized protein F5891DRAFT_980887 [Suillus fuscotomentosus]|uniref:Uncharacterized protein n=1 Tax=Suillus fuscotomentosus TaxID=1912939 RepID=A0AAD4E7A4_9AGAM|nr:uncharacterized protein F5891DRAFT_980887 [Suillus fuscotomentosus]KAG1899643.1 hypothetical protein F5891DRAFT_980887 [Suillus fuscotomentosus]